MTLFSVDIVHLSPVGHGPLNIVSSLYHHPQAQIAELSCYRIDTFRYFVFRQSAKQTKVLLQTNI